MPLVQRSTLLACLVTFLSVSAHAADSDTRTHADAPLATIRTLDVQRYMGVWYEIARYPAWFQSKCASDSQAEYALQADGRVRVVNRCRLENGEPSEAQGTARQIGGAGSAKLEVRFAPAWLSFLPFVWGDYWVIDLDPEYQLVAVSEPAREYLWILSRTPSVDEARLEALMSRLEAKGFDRQRLLYTRHDRAP